MHPAKQRVWIPIASFLTVSFSVIALALVIFEYSLRNAEAISAGIISGYVTLSLVPLLLLVGCIAGRLARKYEIGKKGLGIGILLGSIFGAMLYQVLLKLSGLVGLWDVTSLLAPFIFSAIIFGLGACIVFIFKAKHPRPIAKHWWIISQTVFAILGGLIGILFVINMAWGVAGFFSQSSAKSYCDFRTVGSFVCEQELLSRFGAQFQNWQECQNLIASYVPLNSPSSSSDSPATVCVETIAAYHRDVSYCKPIIDGSLPDEDFKYAAFNSPQSFLECVDFVSQQNGISYKVDDTVGVFGRYFFPQNICESIFGGSYPEGCVFDEIHGAGHPIFTNK